MCGRGTGGRAEQGELRTSGVCLSACHAGNIPDDVVNVQSGTRPPGGTAEAAWCGLTPFNVSHNCAEDVTVGVEDGDFSPTHERPIRAAAKPPVNATFAEPRMSRTTDLGSRSAELRGQRPLGSPS